MQKKDSRMSQLDAKIADKLEKAKEDLQEQEKKCSQLLAQNVEKKHKFLSNQVTRDRFIAANATRQRDNPRSFARGLYKVTQAPIKRLGLLLFLSLKNYMEA